MVHARAVQSVQDVRQMHRRQHGDTTSCTYIKKKEAQFYVTLTQIITWLNTREQTTFGLTFNASDQLQDEAFDLILLKRHW